MNKKLFRILEELGWCAYIVILVNSVQMIYLGGLGGFIGGLSGLILVMMFRTIDIWEFDKDFNKENGKRKTNGKRKKK